MDTTGIRAVVTKPAAQVTAVQCTALLPVKAILYEGGKCRAQQMIGMFAILLWSDRFSNLDKPMNFWHVNTRAIGWAN